MPWFIYVFMENYVKIGHSFKSFKLYILNKYKNLQNFYKSYNFDRKTLNNLLNYFRKLFVLAKQIYLQWNDQRECWKN